MNLKNEIVNLFESQEMRQCIKAEYSNIGITTKAGIIKGARLDIRKKLHLLEKLYDENSGVCKNGSLLTAELENLKSDINEYRAAVGHFKAMPGDVYIVGEYGFDNGVPDVPKMYGYCPYTSFYAAMRYIKSEWEEAKQEYNSGEVPTFWYTIEKYSAEGENMREKICWRVMPDGKVTDFGGIHEINVPHPFSEGDIVLMDCTPFLPPRVGVIIETDPNPNDCCMPQALCMIRDGKFCTGAVKHGSVFRDYGYHSLFSPMYRLKIYDGALTGKEKILYNISRKLKEQGDNKEHPTLGNILWNNIYNANKSGKGISLEALNELLERSKKEWSLKEFSG